MVPLTCDKTIEARIEFTCVARHSGLKHIRKINYTHTHSLIRHAFHLYYVREVEFIHYVYFDSSDLHYTFKKHRSKTKILVTQEDILRDVIPSEHRFEFSCYCFTL